METSRFMNDSGKNGKEKPPYLARCLNNYRNDCFAIQ